MSSAFNQRNFGEGQAQSRQRSLDVGGRLLKLTSADDQPSWNHTEAQAQRVRKQLNQVSERPASLSSRSARKSPELTIKHLTGIAASPRMNAEICRPPLPARGYAWTELPTPARQRTSRCSETNHESAPERQRNRRCASPFVAINCEDEMARQGNQRSAPPAVTDERARQRNQRCASPAIADELAGQRNQRCPSPAVADELPRQRNQRCSSPAVADEPARQRNQRCASPSIADELARYGNLRCAYPSGADESARHGNQICFSPSIVESNHKHASHAKENMSQNHSQQETISQWELRLLLATPGEELKRPSSCVQRAERVSSAGDRSAAPQRPFSAVLAESKLQEAPGTRTESQLRKRLRKARTLAVANGEAPQMQKDQHSQAEEIIEGRPVTSAELGKWSSAFSRFVHDGEIHKDNLKPALRLCGYEDLRDDIICQVATELTWYNTLDRHEYIRFVCLYEAGLYKHYHLEFQQFDQDGSGKIGPEKLRALLSKIGVVPRAIVLEDLIAEVSTGGSMSIDYQGFEQVQKNIMKCDGFLRSELEELHGVFQNFDRDHSGDMNIRELASALTWLGFPLSADKISVICELEDADRNGTISEREFVRCLRRIYEEEIRQIHRFLTARTCGERVQHGQELDSLLRKLGYTASPQAVVDALEESGLRYERVCSLDIESVSFFDRVHSLEALHLNLDADQICLLLKTLRSRNGFTEADMTSFKETFDRHSTELGELQNIAIRKALRWLGHPLPLDVLWKLVAEVDVEGERSLDFTMFVKLIRKCRDRDRQIATEVFRRLDQGTGVLDRSQQDIAFRNLECLDDEGRPPRRSNEELAGLDLDSFLDICSRFRVHRLHWLRKHEGFSHAELAELQDSFATFDKNRDGVIGRRELARLIEFLFPERAHKVEFRPYLTNLLSEIDADRSQTVDWGEFVCLMRKIRDHDAEQRFASEQMIISELQFSYAEIKDFRELFLGADTEGSCKLSVNAIAAMLSRSGVMNEKHHDSLKSFFDSAVKKGTGSADFLEFLQIMSNIIHAGWFSDEPKVRPKSATLRSSR
eukprot:TRINITY_DN5090_c0_g1_i1.p1 TRINITY_DN5090_c0_g1~~TRINITY_DN5090_c0_g1_i1.p1  ORF type:complete len:1049 (+),score=153.75 TRINITY_DN5090_c0_g1_i1:201-3347(+)